MHVHKSLTKTPHHGPGVRATRMRTGLSVLAVAALLVLGGCAQDSGNGPVQVVDQGYQSGDGSITTFALGDRTEPVALDGVDYEDNPVDTTQFYGDVVVLNTWYAACPPCRAEAPDLVALEELFTPEGVHFLGINRTDAPGAAQAFEREYGVTWASINDSSGSAVASLAGVVPIKAVPTTVVLDRSGRVAARVLGQIDKSTLKALIGDVLAEGN